MLTSTYSDNTYMQTTDNVYKATCSEKGKSVQKRDYYQGGNAEESSFCTDFQKMGVIWIYGMGKLPI